MAAARKLISRVLSHNDNHFVIVNMGGEDLHLCTRCTGMLLGFAISILPVILLRVYQAPGKLVTGIALLFAIPDFLYWTLTRLQLVPDVLGIRVLCGFFLGIYIALIGQANISWLMKILIVLGLFVLAIVLDHTVVRKRKYLRTERSI